MKGIARLVKKELEDFEKLFDGPSEKHASKNDFIEYHGKKLQPPHAVEIVVSYVVLSIVQKTLIEAMKETIKDKPKG